MVRGAGAGDLGELERRGGGTAGRRRRRAGGGSTRGVLRVVVEALLVELDPGEPVEAEAALVAEAGPAVAVRGPRAPLAARARHGSVAAVEEPLGVVDRGRARPRAAAAQGGEQEAGAPPPEKRSSRWLIAASHEEGVRSVVVVPIHRRHHRRRRVQLESERAAHDRDRREGHAERGRRGVQAVSRRGVEGPRGRRHEDGVIARRPDKIQADPRIHRPRQIDRRHDVA
mmetsp:Transcript_4232/g.17153  ORF Transcript_4232/g.17153 Transcript_4232/m.17153 type:complete len:228 (-) Transcript_4232:3376-4059(-)